MLTTTRSWSTAQRTVASSDRERSVLGGDLELFLTDNITTVTEEEFVIIDNDGVNAISGTFNGLPEGASITLGTATFTISYTGGTGNDVVLTTSDSTTFTKFWDGEGDGVNWTDAANWSGDTLPGPSDDVLIDFPGDNLFRIASGSQTVNSLYSEETLQIDGGTLTLTAASTMNDGLTLSSGILTLSDTLDLSGNSVWSGGVLAGTGTLDNSGILSLTGASKFLQATFALINSGTLSIDTTLQLNANNISSATTLTNQASGTIELFSDADIDWLSGTIPTPQVTNAGTIVKSSGVGQSFIDDLQNLGGTLDVQSGELQLRDFSSGELSTGGTFTVSAGAVLDLAGGNERIYQGTYTGSGLGSVRLSSGTINAGTGATFNFPDGLFDWTGGTFGSGTFTNQDTITLSGASTKALSSAATFLNEGTLAVEGTGSLLLFANNISLASVLTNTATGTIDIASDADLDWVSGTIPNPQITNAGTIRKSAGADVSFIDELVIDGGTVEAQTGEIELRNFGDVEESTGGILNASPGAVIDLTGASTRGYAGTYTGSGGGTIELSNGILEPGTDAEFNFPGTMFQWSGGTIQEGTLGNSGTLTLAGTGFKTVAPTGAIDNSGTINVVGTGDFRVQANNISRASQITNSGLIDVQANADLNWVSGSIPTPQFINTGELRVSGGASTALNYNLDNTGLVNVDNGLFDITLSVAQVSGATLAGGSWDIGSSGTLSLPGPNFSINQGDVTLRGSASFNQINDLVDNQGTFELRDTATFATTGTFDNSGDVTIDTTSRLEVLDTYRQTGGTTRVDGAMQFLSSGGQPQVLVDGGTLRGDGVLDASGTPFTLDAQLTAAAVTPGEDGAAGSLEINGPLTLAGTSTTKFDLADGVAGTNYDQLIPVSGAALAGTLNLNAIGAVTPGQQFTIIDSVGPITGSFTGVGEAATVSDGTNDYQITYAGGDGFDVVLTALAANNTVVETSSGNLAITDSNSNADSLTITTSGSNYVITSAAGNLSTTIPTATGDGTASITVPFSAITGRQVSVNTGDGNDSVTIGGTFDPSNASAEASSLFDLLLTLGAGTDSVTWNGASTLDELVVGAELIALNAGITTTGDQTFSGDLTLGADVVLNAGNDVDFLFPINGAQSLTVNTSGTTTFGSVVGSTTPLTSITTDSGGTTVVEGNTFTIGNQTYGDNVRLGNSLTFTSNTGAVTFSRDVNATTAGVEAMTVAGDAFFNSNVGGGVEFASLTVLGATSTNIDSRVINTTGSQVYTGPFQAVQTRTLNSSGGGTIAFGSTIDAAVNGDATLTINTAGTTTFSGNIGTTTLLGDLITDAAGTTEFGGAVTDVRTRNDQTFNDPVTLNGSTTFTAEEGSSPGKHNV